MANILVVGSLNTDYVIDVETVVSEGETVLGSSSESHFGGKGANQAVALARLGATVTMAGAVGKDEEGKALKNALEDEGINTSFIQTLNGVLSGKAFIQRTAHDNAIVVAPGANMAFDGALDDLPLDSFDLLVLQNEIPMSVNEKFIEKAQAKGLTIIYNPAPAQSISNSVLRKIDYLILNETEARTLTGLNTFEEGAIKMLLNQLSGMVKQSVILTRGAKGVSYTHGETTLSMPAFQITPVDTTGAGDSAVAGFSFALSQGKSLHESIRLAQMCGALAATKKGAQPSLPTMKEVLSSPFNQ